MRRFSVARFLLCLFMAAFSSSQVAYAVGLGKIITESNLYQPFKATIEVYNTGKLNPEDFYITLGVVKESGIDSAVEESELYKRKVKFAVELLGDGKGLIHITTRHSLREPFLHFTLSVETPLHQAIKEYTVLLDPVTHLSE